MGITCRGRTEEGILATSMLSIVLWILQCYQNFVSIAADRIALYNEIELKCIALISSMLSSSFTITMLYLAKHDDKGWHWVEFIRVLIFLLDLYLDVVKKCKEIERKVLSDKTKYAEVEACLQKLQKIELKSGTECESVTYCLQPLLSVEITINPCAETSYLVNKLVMLQRLKVWFKSCPKQRFLNFFFVAVPFQIPAFLIFLFNLFKNVEFSGHSSSIFHHFLFMISGQFLFIFFYFPLNFLIFLVFCRIRL